MSNLTPGVMAEAMQTFAAGLITELDDLKDEPLGGTRGALGTMEPGDTIAVTVEPAGGAPGGAPTTDPLFAIPTA